MSMLPLPWVYSVFLNWAVIELFCLLWVMLVDPFRVVKCIFLLPDTEVLGLPTIWSWFSLSLKLNLCADYWWLNFICYYKICYSYSISFYYWSWMRSWALASRSFWVFTMFYRLGLLGLKIAVTGSSADSFRSGIVHKTGGGVGAIWRHLLSSSI